MHRQVRFYTHQYSGARCSGQAAYVAKRQECAK
ncbi:hypothetical protein [Shigella flexneri]|nr:hypothetical protein [Shigella flexneri]